MVDYSKIKKHMLDLGKKVGLLFVFFFAFFLVCFDNSASVKVAGYDDTTIGNDAPEVSVLGYYLNNGSGGYVQISDYSTDYYYYQNITIKIKVTDSSHIKSVKYTYATSKPYSSSAFTNAISASSGENSSCNVGYDPSSPNSQSNIESICFYYLDSSIDSTLNGTYNLYIDAIDVKNNSTFSKGEYTPLIENINIYNTITVSTTLTIEDKLYHLPYVDVKYLYFITDYKGTKTESNVCTTNLGSYCHYDVGYSRIVITDDESGYSVVSEDSQTTKVTITIELSLDNLVYYSNGIKIGGKKTTSSAFAYSYRKYDLIYDSKQIFDDCNILNSDCSSNEHMKSGFNDSDKKFNNGDSIILKYYFYFDNIGSKKLTDFYPNYSLETLENIGSLRSCEYRYKFMNNISSLYLDGKSVYRNNVYFYIYCGSVSDGTTTIEETIAKIQFAPIIQENILGSVTLSLTADTVSESASGDYTGISTSYLFTGNKISFSYTFDSEVAIKYSGSVELPTFFISINYSESGFVMLASGSNISCSYSSTSKKISCSYTITNDNKAEKITEMQIGVATNALGNFVDYGTNTYNYPNIVISCNDLYINKSPEIEVASIDTYIKKGDYYYTFSQTLTDGGNIYGISSGVKTQLTLSVSFVRKNITLGNTSVSVSSDYSDPTLTNVSKVTRGTCDTTFCSYTVIVYTNSIVKDIDKFEFKEGYIKYTSGDTTYSSKSYTYDEKKLKYDNTQEYIFSRNAFYAEKDDLGYYYSTLKLNESDKEYFGVTSTSPKIIGSINTKLLHSNDNGLISDDSYRAKVSFDSGKNVKTYTISETVYNIYGKEMKAYNDGTDITIYKAEALQVELQKDSDKYASCTTYEKIIKIDENQYAYYYEAGGESNCYKTNNVNYKFYNKNDYEFSVVESQSVTFNTSSLTEKENTIIFAFCDYSYKINSTFYPYDSSKVKVIPNADLSEIYATDGFVGKEYTLKFEVEDTNEYQYEGQTYSIGNAITVKNATASSKDYSTMIEYNSGNYKIKIKQSESIGLWFEKVLTISFMGNSSSNYTSLTGATYFTNGTLVNGNVTITNELSIIKPVNPDESNLSSFSCNNSGSSVACTVNVAFSYLTIGENKYYYVDESGTMQSSEEADITNYDYTLNFVAGADTEKPKLLKISGPYLYDNDTGCTTSIISEIYYNRVQKFCYELIVEENSSDDLKYSSSSNLSIIRTSNAVKFFDVSSTKTSEENITSSDIDGVTKQVGYAYWKVVYLMELGANPVLDSVNYGEPATDYRIPVLKGDEASSYFPITDTKGNSLTADESTGVDSNEFKIISDLTIQINLLGYTDASEKLVSSGAEYTFRIISNRKDTNEAVEYAIKSGETTLKSGTCTTTGTLSNGHYYYECTISYADSGIDNSSYKSFTIYAKVDDAYSYDNYKDISSTYFSYKFPSTPVISQYSSGWKEKTITITYNVNAGSSEPLKLKDSLNLSNAISEITSVNECPSLLSKATLNTDNFKNVGTISLSISFTDCEASISEISVTFYGGIVISTIDSNIKNAETVITISTQYDNIKYEITEHSVTNDSPLYISSVGEKIKIAELLINKDVSDESVIINLKKLVFTSSSYSEATLSYEKYGKVIEIYVSKVVTIPDDAKQIIFTIDADFITSNVGSEAYQTEGDNPTKIEIATNVFVKKYGITINQLSESGKGSCVLNKGTYYCKKGYTLVITETLSDARSLNLSDASATIGEEVTQIISSEKFSQSGTTLSITIEIDDALGNLNLSISGIKDTNGYSVSDINYSLLDAVTIINGVSVGESCNSQYIVTIGDSSNIENILFGRCSNDLITSYVIEPTNYKEAYVKNDLFSKEETISSIAIKGTTILGDVVTLASGFDIVIEPNGAYSIKVAIKNCEYSNASKKEECSTTTNKIASVTLTDENKESIEKILGSTASDLIKEKLNAIENLVVINNETIKLNKTEFIYEDTNVKITMILSASNIGTIAEKQMTLADLPFEIADKVYDGTTAVIEGSISTTEFDITDDNGTVIDHVTLTVNYSDSLYYNENVNSTAKVYVAISKVTSANEIVYSALDHVIVEAKITPKAIDIYDFVSGDEFNKVYDGSYEIPEGTSTKSKTYTYSSSAETLTINWESGLYEGDYCSIGNGSNSQCSIKLNNVSILNRGTNTNNYSLNGYDSSNDYIVVKDSNGNDSKATLSAKTTNIKTIVSYENLNDVILDDSSTIDVSLSKIVSNSVVVLKFDISYNEGNGLNNTYTLYSCDSDYSTCISLGENKETYKLTSTSYYKLVHKNYSGYEYTRKINIEVNLFTIKKISSDINSANGLVATTTNVFINDTAYIYIKFSSAIKESSLSVNNKVIINDVTNSKTYTFKNCTIYFETNDILQCSTTKLEFDNASSNFTYSSSDFSSLYNIYDSAYVSGTPEVDIKFNFISASSSLETISYSVIQNYIREGNYVYTSVNGEKDSFVGIVVDNKVNIRGSSYDVISDDGTFSITRENITSLTEINGKNILGLSLKLDFSGTINEYPEKMNLLNLYGSELECEVDSSDSSVLLCGVTISGIYKEGSINSSSDKYTITFENENPYTINLGLSDFALIDIDNIAPSYSINSSNIREKEFYQTATVEFYTYQETSLWCVAESPVSVNSDCSTNKTLTITDTNSTEDYVAYIFDSAWNSTQITIDNSDIHFVRDEDFYVERYSIELSNKNVDGNTYGKGTKAKVTLEFSSKLSSNNSVTNLTISDASDISVTTKNEYAYINYTILDSFNGDVKPTITFSAANYLGITKSFEVNAESNYEIDNTGATIASFTPDTTTLVTIGSKVDYTVTVNEIVTVDWGKITLKDSSGVLYSKASIIDKNSYIENNKTTITFTVSVNNPTTGDIFHVSFGAGAIADHVNNLNVSATDLPNMIANTKKPEFTISSFAATSTGNYGNSSSTLTLNLNNSYLANNNTIDYTKICLVNYNNNKEICVENAEENQTTFSFDLSTIDLLIDNGNYVYVVIKEGFLVDVYGNKSITTSSSKVQISDVKPTISLTNFNVESSFVEGDYYYYFAEGSNLTFKVNELTTCSTDLSKIKVYDGDTEYTEDFTISCIDGVYSITKEDGDSNTYYLSFESGFVTNVYGNTSEAYVSKNDRIYFSIVSNTMNITASVEGVYLDSANNYYLYGDYAKISFESDVYIAKFEIDGVEKDKNCGLNINDVLITGNTKTYVFKFTNNVGTSQEMTMTFNETPDAPSISANAYAKYYKSSSFTNEINVPITFTITAESPFNQVKPNYTSYSEYRVVNGIIVRSVYSYSVDANGYLTSNNFTVNNYFGTSFTFTNGYTLTSVGNGLKLSVCSDVLDSNYGCVDSNDHEYYLSFEGDMIYDVENESEYTYSGYTPYLSFTGKVEYSIPEGLFRNNMELYSNRVTISFNVSDANFTLEPAVDYYINNDNEYVVKEINNNQMSFNIIGVNLSNVVLPSGCSGTSNPITCTLTDNSITFAANSITVDGLGNSEQSFEFVVDSEAPVISDVVIKVNGNVIDSETYIKENDEVIVILTFNETLNDSVIPSMRLFNLFIFDGSYDKDNNTVIYDFIITSSITDGVVTNTFSTTFKDLLGNELTGSNVFNSLLVVDTTAPQLVVDGDYTVSLINGGSYSYSVHSSNSEVLEFDPEKIYVNKYFNVSYEENETHTILTVTISIADITRLSEGSYDIQFGAGLIKDSVGNENTTIVSKKITVVIHEINSVQLSADSSCLEDEGNYYCNDTFYVDVNFNGAVDSVEEDSYFSAYDSSGNLIGTASFDTINYNSHRYIGKIKESVNEVMIDHVVYYKETYGIENIAVASSYDVSEQKVYLDNVIPNIGNITVIESQYLVKDSNKNNTYNIGKDKEFSYTISLENGSKVSSEYSTKTSLLSIGSENVSDADAYILSTVYENDLITVRVKVLNSISFRLRLLEGLVIDNAGNLNKKQIDENVIVIHADDTSIQTLNVQNVTEDGQNDGTYYLKEGKQFKVTVVFNSTISGNIPTLKMNIGSTEVAMDSPISITDSNTLVYTHTIVAGENGAITFGVFTFGENESLVDSYSNAVNLNVTNISSNVIVDTTAFTVDLEYKSRTHYSNAKVDYNCESEANIECSGDLLNINNFSFTKNGEAITNTNITLSIINNTITFEGLPTGVIKVKVNSGSVSDYAGNTNTESSYTLLASDSDEALIDISSYSISTSSGCNSNTCGVGQTLTINVVLNKQISTITNAILNFKIGEVNKSVTSTTFNDTTIIFTYVVKEGDNGELALTSLNGIVSSLNGIYNDTYTNSLLTTSTGITIRTSSSDVTVGVNFDSCALNSGFRYCKLGDTFVVTLTLNDELSKISSYNNLTISTYFGNYKGSSYNDNVGGTSSSISFNIVIDSKESLETFEITTFAVKIVDNFGNTTSVDTIYVDNNVRLDNTKPTVSVTLDNTDGRNGYYSRKETSDIKLNITTNDNFGFTSGSNYSICLVSTYDRYCKDDANSIISVSEGVITIQSNNLYAGTYKVEISSGYIVDYVGSQSELYVSDNLIFVTESDLNTTVRTEGCNDNYCNAGDKIYIDIEFTNGFNAVEGETIYAYDETKENSLAFEIDTVNSTSTKHIFVHTVADNENIALTQFDLSNLSTTNYPEGKLGSAARNGTLGMNIVVDTKVETVESAIITSSNCDNDICKYNGNYYVNAGQRIFIQVSFANAENVKDISLVSDSLKNIPFDNDKYVNDLLSVTIKNVNGNTTKTLSFIVEDKAGNTSTSEIDLNIVIVFANGLIADNIELVKGTVDGMNPTSVTGINITNNTGVPIQSVQYYDKDNNLMDTTLVGGTYTPSEAIWFGSDATLYATGDLKIKVTDIAGNEKIITKDVGVSVEVPEYQFALYDGTNQLNLTIYENKEYYYIFNKTITVQLLNITGQNVSNVKYELNGVVTLNVNYAESFTMDLQEGKNTLTITATNGYNNSGIKEINVLYIKPIITNYYEDSNYHNNLKLKFNGLNSKFTMNVNYDLKVGETTKYSGYSYSGMKTNSDGETNITLDYSFDDGIYSLVGRLYYATYPSYVYNFTINDLRLDSNGPIIGTIPAHGYDDDSVSIVVDVSDSYSGVDRVEIHTSSDDVEVNTASCTYADNKATCTFTANVTGNIKLVAYDNVGNVSKSAAFTFDGIDKSGYSVSTSVYSKAKEDYYSKANYGETTYARNHKVYIDSFNGDGSPLKIFGYMFVSANDIEHNNLVANEFENKCTDANVICNQYTSSNLPTVLTLENFGGNSLTGQYILYLYTKDEASNKGLNIISLYYDNTSPTISFNVKSETNYMPYTSEELANCMSVIDNEVGYNAEDYVFTFKDLEENVYNINSINNLEGDYVMTISVQDKLGNASQKDVNIKIDNVGPSIERTNKDKVFANPEYKITSLHNEYVANDIQYVVIDRSTSSSGIIESITNDTFNIPINNGDNITIKIVIKDNVGNATTYTEVIGYDDVAPTIAITSFKLGTNGNVLTKNNGFIIDEEMYKITTFTNQSIRIKDIEISDDNSGVACYYVAFSVDASSNLPISCTTIANLNALDWYYLGVEGENEPIQLGSKSVIKSITKNGYLYIGVIDNAGNYNISTVKVDTFNNVGINNFVLSLENVTGFVQSNKLNLNISGYDYNDITSIKYGLYRGSNTADLVNNPASIFKKLSQISLSSSGADDAGNITFTSDPIITENGIYIVEIIDKWGNSNYKYVEVTNIDTTSPTFNKSLYVYGTNVYEVNDSVYTKRDSSHKVALVNNKAFIYSLDSISAGIQIEVQSKSLKDEALYVNGAMSKVYLRVCYGSVSDDTCTIKQAMNLNYNGYNSSNSVLNLVSEGTKNVIIYLEDDAGNTSEQITFSITNINEVNFENDIKIIKDTTEYSLTTLPQEYNNALSLRFTNVDTPLLSKIVYYLLDVNGNIMNGVGTTISSNFSNTYDFTTGLNLDGTYRIKYVVTDILGNEKEYNADQYIYLDTISPIINENMATFYLIKNADDTYSLKINVIKDELEEIDYDKLNVYDENSNLLCQYESGSSVLNTTCKSNAPLTNNKYVVKTQLIDKAGNTSGFKNYTIEYNDSRMVILSETYKPESKSVEITITIQKPTGNIQSIVVYKSDNTILKSITPSGALIYTFDIDKVNYPSLFTDDGVINTSLIVKVTDEDENGEGENKGLIQNSISINHDTNNPTIILNTSIVEAITTLNNDIVYEFTSNKVLTNPRYIIRTTEYTSIDVSSFETNARSCDLVKGSCLTGNLVLDSDLNYKIVLDHTNTKVASLISSTYMFVIYLEDSDFNKAINDTYTGIKVDNTAPSISVTGAINRGIIDEIYDIYNSEVALTITDATTNYYSGLSSVKVNGVEFTCNQPCDISFGGEASNYPSGKYVIEATDAIGHKTTKYIYVDTNNDVGVELQLNNVAVDMDETYLSASALAETSLKITSSKPLKELVVCFATSSGTIKNCKRKITLTDGNYKVGDGENKTSSYNLNSNVVIPLNEFIMGDITSETSVTKILIRSTNLALLQSETITYRVDFSNPKINARSGYAYENKRISEFNDSSFVLNGEHICVTAKTCYSLEFAVKSSADYDHDALAEQLDIIFATKLINNVDNQPYSSARSTNRLKVSLVSSSRNNEHINDVYNTNWSDIREWEGLVENVLDRTGKYVYKFTYADAAGNEATPIYFILNVVDSSKPTLTLNDTRTKVSLQIIDNFGVSYTDSGASADDNYGFNDDGINNTSLTRETNDYTYIKLLFKYNGENIELTNNQYKVGNQVYFTKNDKVYTFYKNGTYQFIYEVSDSSNNIVSKTISIIVSDKTSPYMVEQDKELIQVISNEFTIGEITYTLDYQEEMLISVSYTDSLGLHTITVENDEFTIGNIIYYVDGSYILVKQIYEEININNSKICFYDGVENCINKYSKFTAFDYEEYTSKNINIDASIYWSKDGVKYNKIYSSSVADYYSLDNNVLDTDAFKLKSIELFKINYYKFMITTKDSYNNTRTITYIIKVLDTDNPIIQIGDIEGIDETIVEGYKADGYGNGDHIIIDIPMDDDFLNTIAVYSGTTQEQKINKWIQKKDNKAISIIQNYIGDANMDYTYVQIDNTYTNDYANKIYMKVDFNVIASDSSGNTTTITITYRLIDEVKPTTNGITLSYDGTTNSKGKYVNEISQTDNIIINKKTLYFMINAASDNVVTNNYFTYEYKITTEENRSTSKWQTYTGQSTLAISLSDTYPNEKIKIIYRVVDACGNVSLEAETKYFMFDNVAPTISAVEQLEEGDTSDPINLVDGHIYYGGKTIRVSVVDNVNYRVHYTIKMKQYYNNAFVDEKEMNATTVFDVSDFGVYKFVAYDEAGNESTFEFIIIPSNKKLNVVDNDGLMDAENATINTATFDVISISTVTKTGNSKYYMYYDMEALQSINNDDKIYIMGVIPGKNISFFYLSGNSISGKAFKSAINNSDNNCLSIPLDKLTNIVSDESEYANYMMNMKDGIQLVVAILKDTPEDTPVTPKKTSYTWILYIIGGLLSIAGVFLAMKLRKRVRAA